MLVPVLSLFATMCTPPPAEVATVPYATQEMIAVVRDKKTVVLCDPATGRWLGATQVAWGDGESCRAACAERQQAHGDCRGKRAYGGSYL